METLGLGGLQALGKSIQARLRLTHLKIGSNLGELVDCNRGTHCYFPVNKSFIVIRN